MRTIVMCPKCDGGGSRHSPKCDLAPVSDTAEVGTCDLCGQEMIRTADDCWHPWNVERACPPEPDDSTGWTAWFAAGNSPGRPGREHWQPAA